MRDEYDLIKDRNNLTNEDLVTILKGWDVGTSVYSKDHDEFTKLRNRLEEEGYIKTERSWCNGDRVLKPFKLNEWTFNKGDQFASAPALSNSIFCARKNGRKTLGI